MSDLEIGFKLFDQMIVFWQFYIGGLVGVVGWVFARDHAWPFDKRLGISITFSLFSLINMSAIYKTTSSLTGLFNVFTNEKYKIPPSMSQSVFEIASTRLNAGEWYLHIALHLIADIIAVYFVMKLAKNEPKQS